MIQRDLLTARASVGEHYSTPTSIAVRKGQPLRYSPPVTGVDCHRDSVVVALTHHRDCTASSRATARRSSSVRAG